MVVVLGEVFSEEAVVGLDEEPNSRPKIPEPDWDDRLEFSKEWTDWSFVGAIFEKEEQERDGLVVGVVSGR